MKKLFKYIFLFIMAIIIFTNDKVYAEDKWIGECTYERVRNGITYSFNINFNSQKMAGITISPSSGETIGFTKDDIVNYYEEYNKCPDNLYVHKKGLNGEINLDPNDYSGIYERKSQNFYSENDNWITEKDEYLSQCYYKLFTGGDETDGNNFSSDLISLNFNNNGFNISIVDKDLNKKGGNTLLMNSGGTITYGGYNIELEELKTYYNGSATGCPAYLKWDWDNKINLPTSSKSAKFTLKLNSEKSSSKNHEVNLDGTPTTFDPTLPTYEEGCKSMLGSPDTPGSPAYYLVKAFHVIKYVALVLLLVLSVMDFTNAIAKQDKDAMAKVLKKLMMRFILCIIIFLLPYLISLLLKYLVEVQTDLCGVK